MYINEYCLFFFPAKNEEVHILFTSFQRVHVFLNNGNFNSVTEF